MNNKKRFLLTTSFVILMSIIIVSASIDYKNVDIPKSYGPGQLLEGSFELELDEEPTNSLLRIVLEKGEDIVDKSINLLDFLEMSETNFTCEPADCKPLYEKISPGLSTRLDFGESYIGFVVETGNDTQIDSLSFTLDGNGFSESCGVPPAIIDILNDGTVDWQFTNPGDFCNELSPSETYDDAVSTATFEIGDIHYCEKMGLTKSGRFKLGINMVNASTVAPIIMSINDFELGDSVECNVVPGNGIRTCEVNFSVTEEKDFYICVQSSDESDYKIRAETSSPNCGKFGLEEFECSESSIDYAIYAQPAAFEVFDEEEEFNSEVFSEFNSEELTAYLQSYIDEEYAGSCGEGCIIPVKVIASQEEIEMTNLSFRYKTQLGTVDEDKFYSIDKDEALIDMAYEELQLSKADFNVPSIYGDYDLEIFMGDNRIKDTTIEVEEVPIIEAVTPLTVFAVVETEFSVFVSSPKNNSVILYEWDFGDGFSSVTESPFVRHSYPSGVFTLSVTATDDEGLSATKSFDVNTLQPKEAVNQTIEDKRRNLNQMLNSLESLPSWYRGIAENAINLDKIATDLSSYRDEAKIPGADYAAIKSSLDNFVVYSGIRNEEAGLSVVVPVINVGYLRGAGEIIEVGKEEEIKVKIGSWLGTNIDLRVGSTIKVADADTSPEEDLDLLTIFEVKLDVKDVAKNNVFLFVRAPGFAYEDFMFEGNGSVNKIDNGFSLVFDRVESESLVFALAGGVGVEELEIFASPTVIGLEQPDVYCGNAICDKSAGEDYKGCPEDCPKPITWAVLLGVLILAGVGAGIYFIWKYYVIMYEKKQIKKLFASEREFYGLTFFIANAINKGQKEKTVREKLEKAEWKADQLKLAFAKVKEQTKRMQKQSLLNFILKQMQAGKKITEIRVQLGKAGWETPLINWAVKKAKKMSRKIKK